MKIEKGTVLSYISRQYNKKIRDFFIEKFNLDEEMLQRAIGLINSYWDIEDKELKKIFWNSTLVPECLKLTKSDSIDNISLLVRIARQLYFE